MIGDRGSGKTSLMLQFKENTFTTCKLSKGAYEHCACIVQYAENSLFLFQNIQLNIWDTYSQPGFRFKYSSYKTAILFLIDMTEEKEEAFRMLALQKQELSCHTPARLPKMIVGTKADDTNNLKISEQDIADLAKSVGFFYQVTSAKDDKGITEAFGKLTHQIMNNRKICQNNNITKNKRNILN